MNLVTAISAVAGCKRDKPAVKTYANIILRPQPRRGSKFTPIKLTNDEALCIFGLLEYEFTKWYWVVGREHTKFIYMESEGSVKITSVSAFYSGAVKNQFNVLEQRGKNWLRVETLKAGTDWYYYPIPSHLLHRVYSFRGALPKCGSVVLPVITISGSAWIERDQIA